MTLLFRTERHWRGATEFMRSARAPFAKPRSEKGIVLFLLGDGRQRPVARTEEGVGRQAEDLLAHLLPGQFPGLMAASEGAGENGVADNGHAGLGAWSFSGAWNLEFDRPPRFSPVPYSCLSPVRQSWPAPI